MRKRVFDFLFKRSSAGSDAAQAAYLGDTVVPAVEGALYAGAAGDRGVYLDGSTLKARLKAVFAQQASLLGSGGGSAQAAPAEPAAPAPAPAPAPPPAATPSKPPPASPNPLRAYLRRASAAEGGTSSLPGSPVSMGNTSLSGALLLPSPQGRGGGRSSSSGAGSAALTPRAPPQPPTPASAPGDGRWGAVPHPGSAPVRHYPAQLGGGGLRMTLVLEARPDAPPHLPTLNKWQARRCADCGELQSTGLFGARGAHFCAYTELLFCDECMAPSAGEGGGGGGGGGGVGVGPGGGPQLGTSSSGNRPPLTPAGHCARALPWRIVQLGDDAPLPVSRAAAEFIDALWGKPVVALTAVAPGVHGASRALQRLAALRARLVDARVRVVQAGMRSGRGGGAGGGGADGGGGGSGGGGGGGGGAGGEEAVLLSEAPTTVDAMAAASAGAASALAAATDVLRRCLGPRLSFLAEVPELLPLSLVAQLAAPGSELMAYIMARLGKAGVQLTDLAAQLEGAAGAGGARGAGEEAGEEEEEEGGGAAAAAARSSGGGAGRKAAAASRARGY